MSQDPLASGEADPEISHDEIRERPYDLWGRHHRPDGYDLHFWVMAERELKAGQRARLKQEAGSAADDAGSAATVNATATEGPIP